ncbi:MAG: response regulator [Sulfurimonas sp.]|uniref:HD-GYP domain-containing protein n=1 Tax=Sulfurimonas sp. TaxID=2022749 RepID=UPI0026292F4A|nr:HD domain-containing phosphohydrolase [Sulfurimonas sp.]MDD2652891.1 response regulator [Sulfurimonas sp.]MDD3452337.1 response regulator [Sulfurimonas sp.]
MNTINILAVDDEPFNLDLIELTFMDMANVNIIKAMNGRDALEKLPQIDAHVILLDIRMPVMNGLELLEILKKDSVFSKIPVIIITANSEERHKALELGANDFLAKPVDTKELKLRTLNSTTLYKTQLELEALNANLEKAVLQRTSELNEALKLAKETEYEISLRLGLASEYRDLETGMHIKRVSHYSALLGRLFGVSSEDEQLLLYASPLHDIGKIGIPDAVLLKHGKLEASEFKMMQEHTKIGALMLSKSENYPVIEAGRIIALQHHEKYNGTGYPSALKGNEIHLFAKIVAIADVFDALSSKRVYKDAFGLDKTLSIMQSERGTHFDPALLDLFIENIPEFLKIKEQFCDEDEIPHMISLLEEYR